jgi:hypothetical protein
MHSQRDDEDASAACPVGHWLEDDPHQYSPWDRGDLLHDEIHSAGGKGSRRENASRLFDTIREGVLRIKPASPAASVCRISDTKRGKSHAALLRSFIGPLTVLELASVCGFAMPKY